MPYLFSFLQHQQENIRPLTLRQSKLSPIQPGKLTFNVYLASGAYKEAIPIDLHQSYAHILKEHEKLGGFKLQLY